MIVKYSIHQNNRAKFAQLLLNLWRMNWQEPQLDDNTNFLLSKGMDGIFSQASDQCRIFYALRDWRPTENKSDLGIHL